MRTLEIISPGLRSPYVRAIFNIFVSCIAWLYAARDKRGLSPFPEKLPPRVILMCRKLTPT